MFHECVSSVSWIVHLILFVLNILIIFDAVYKSRSFSLCSFVHLPVASSFSWVQIVSTSSLFSNCSSARRWIATRIQYTGKKRKIGSEKELTQTPACLYQVPHLRVSFPLRLVTWCQWSDGGKVCNVAGVGRSKLSWTYHQKFGMFHILIKCTKMY